MKATVRHTMLQMGTLACERLQPMLTLHLELRLHRQGRRLPVRGSAVVDGPAPLPPKVIAVRHLHPRGTEGS